MLDAPVYLVGDALLSEFVVETPPIHPGILGLVLPWNCGLSFKANSLQYKHLGVFIAIPRDLSQDSNAISIDSVGNPVITYTLTDHDKGLMLAGMEAQSRLMRAAGCRIFMPLHEGGEWFTNVDNDEAFESYLRTLVGYGIPLSKMPIFSAHQMSSCRMGTTGPVQLNGELLECKNLYVADGSVLPTSLGVNPMITIEAMAYMISQNIIAKFKTF